MVHLHRVDSGALAFVRLYVWLVLIKVVRNRQRRCAPVVRFAAPPLTSTSQTGTWLLRIARRGLFAGRMFQVLTTTGWLTICNTHEPCLEQSRTPPLDDCGIALAGHHARHGAR